MLCINFGEVLHDVSYIPEIRIALEAMLLKLYTKLAPGWVLIRVNFDPIQEIRPKVGGGRSFASANVPKMADKCMQLTAECHLCDTIG